MFDWFLTLYWVAPLALIGIPLALLVVTRHVLVRSLPPGARYPTLLITGLVGVPIHEAAHALTAMLCGLKVVRIGWFEPDPDSGTLGYVHYQYNPQRRWEVFAAALTGLAPLFATLGIVYLFWWGVADEVPLWLDVGSGTWQGGMVVRRLWEWIAEDAVWRSLVVLVVGTIALHGVPSRADLLPGLRAWVALIPVGLLLGALVTWVVHWDWSSLLPAVVASLYLLANLTLHAVLLATLACLPFLGISVLVKLLYRSPSATTPREAR